MVKADGAASSSPAIPRLRRELIREAAIMLKAQISRRGMLLSAAAGVAAVSTAEAMRCSAAPTAGSLHVDIPDQATLYKALKAGVAASGGKTFRLAANTDFGAVGIYGYDFRANPITIVGQAGTRFEWLEFAGAQGMTLRNFNVYGTNKSLHSSVAIQDNCSDVVFNGVTILTGAPEGIPADGTGWLVRNCTNNIQITGRKDTAKPDVSGKGNAVHLTQCSNVTLRNLTITNNGTDGILLAGVSDCTVDACFGTGFYHGEGDHPDFIQGFTAYDGTPIKNITVQNCGWMRGIGMTSQGYFFEDTENLVIKDNWLYGGMTNSSSVSRGKTSTLIDDCYFVGFADGGSAIIIRGQTANATITNTYVGAIDNRRSEGVNPGFSQTGNKLIREVKPGDYTGLDAWLARHPNARARL
jgi:parallel beta-helix repeat protein